MGHRYPAVPSPRHVARVLWLIDLTRRRLTAFCAGTSPPVRETEFKAVRRLRLRRALPVRTMSPMDIRLPKTRTARRPWCKFEVNALPTYPVSFEELPRTTMRTTGLSLLVLSLPLVGALPGPFQKNVLGSTKIFPSVFPFWMFL